MKVILLCLLIKFNPVFSESELSVYWRSSAFSDFWSERTKQLNNQISQQSENVQNFWSERTKQLNNQIYHQSENVKNFLSERTKQLNNQISQQSENVNNVIKKYMSEDKREEIKRGVGSFIEDTKNIINDKLSKYLFKSPSFDIFNSVKLMNKSFDAKFDPDVYLDTIQLIRKNGYNAESHVVKTVDGYLLTMHRIPHARNAPVGSVGKQAVFLQHGLLSSSSDFIITGPSKGLGYILADAGYDVWLGNFRGNTYSKSHVTLSTSDPAFWNFTFHEIGIYDLPIMIDYVNRIKNSETETLYIGHSMGNTALYVLLSTRPEYNTKLKAAFCLGPAAYMTTLKSPIRLLAPYIDNIEWITRHLGINDFLPQNIIMRWFAEGCDKNNFDERICQNIMFLVAGFDEKQFNKTLVSVILGHTPAGASTKTLIHFGQEIRDKGRFQQFDYGAEKNIHIYGQKTPPEYPTSKIVLPIAFFYGDNDWLVGVSDAKKLFKELSNGIELYEVPYKDFNHLDFLWAVDAPSLVYNELLNLMKRFKTSKYWSFGKFLPFDNDVC